MPVMKAVMLLTSRNLLLLLSKLTLKAQNKKRKMTHNLITLLTTGMYINNSFRYRDHCMCMEHKIIVFATIETANVDDESCIPACRYEQNTDKVKKMHRFVDSNDVIDYSTGARKRDIQLKKAEDIEYRDGILQHSSGDTSFKIQNTNDIAQPENSQEKEFSDAFSAHGSYNLDLQQCYIPTKQDGERGKRSLNDQMNKNMMTEERLTANFNISKSY